MLLNSSIYVVTKSSLRGCDGVLPEVTSVTSPEESLPRTVSDDVRMRNRYILYYYRSTCSTKCSTVVQVPWLPEVTEDHVTPKDVEGCVHAQPEIAQYSP